jgi:hypothetical protein
MADIDEQDRVPGRVSQGQRDRIIAHISRHVRTMDALASLARLLKYDANTLMRWLKEDAPDVIILPSVEEPTPGLDLGLGVGISSGILDKLQRSLVDSQAAMVVALLREQAYEMTLGELDAVLSSRIGRLIAHLTVRALLDPSMPLPKLSSGTRGERLRIRNVLSPETPPPAPAPSSSPPPSTKNYDARMLEFLRNSPGWNPPSAIRKALGEPFNEFPAAVRRLQTKGLIVRQGKGRATVYSLKRP